MLQYQSDLVVVGRAKHEHLDEKRVKFVEIGGEIHIHIMPFHHVNIFISVSCSHITRMPDVTDPCKVSEYKACRKSSLFSLLFRDLVMLLLF